MKHVWKMVLLLLLAGMLLGSAAADEAQWNFDEKGFLTGENPGDAYLFEDEENGIWQYASKDLSVKVTRYKDKVGARLWRMYCVAEVYATEQSPLFPILHPQVLEEGDPFPGCHKDHAEVLLAENPAVLAMSDDYYGHRYQTRKKKGSKWPVGIVVRNGEIYFDTTRDSSKKPEFPPLDTLAVYGDGSMKVHVSDEKTAEEYIAEGAVNVFSFGPWLIRNGEVNTKGAVGEKATYATLRYSDSRAVIGMIEPYHYILMVVSVPNEKYIGASGEWLVNKLQEFGCTEAFNMDGGGTACMAFNGKVIMRGDSSKRPLSGMIAFGKLEK